MEPKGSLQHLQQTPTCPYPEPDQSSPYSPAPRHAELRGRISYDHVWGLAMLWASELGRDANLPALYTTYSPTICNRAPSNGIAIN